MQQLDIMNFSHPIWDTLEQSGYVSRETWERCDAYISLLLKWNQSINLIGKSTETDIWTRHILDSLQLLKYIPKDTKILTDFGSGAGLPGLVLALAGIPEVHLIESSYRKATFLQEAASIANTKVIVHNERVENLTPWKTDVITARAFAPLPELLQYIYPFVDNNTLPLLMKGAGVQKELQQAMTGWDIKYTLSPSDTNEDARIISLQSIKPRGNRGH